MTSSDIRIAVIIVNFNGGDDVIKCLKGVSQQSYQPSRIIVVDNCSSDGSQNRISREFPQITLIRQTVNTGFAEGNNLGLEMATDCNWIALLNPDAFPDKEWLAQLVNAINNYPGIEILSSKLIDAKHPNHLDGTGDLYHVCGLSWRRDHGAPLSADENRSDRVFSPCAAAALYKTSLFEKVEGFDENYFCYHEDIDLVFRMRLIGADCRYVSESVAYHVGSGVTGKESDFSIYHGHRNLVWTYFKNMPGWMFWVYLPQHLLLNLITVVYYAIKGKPGLILKSKWHALTGLPRVLRQRRKIQASRVVAPESVRKEMVTGLLKPYLSRHV